MAPAVTPAATPISAISSPSRRIWIAAAGISLLGHVVSMVSISGNKTAEKPLPPVRITVKTNEPEVAKVETIPPKKIEKNKNPPPTKKVEKPQPNAAPVMGVRPDALAEGGKFSAPVGNTLMMEDTGIRKNAKDVKDFQGDLSRDATLVVDTFAKPKYTGEAIDAALEGRFVVEVFVDKSGNVREAELKKKIGYGMDQLVLNAIKGSRFNPRMDKFGNAVDGWTEVKITLELP